MPQDPDTCHLKFDGKNYDKWEDVKPATNIAPSLKPPVSTAVVHPSHYNWFNIECMDVVKHFDFLLGNVIKYVWRSGYKSTTTKLEDLQKAKYYLDLAIVEEEGKIK